MKYLIINGDDFGYSRQRNEGIVKCFREGVVTSTSLIINGTAVDHAVALARKYGIPTGLHLNLSEGTPLTDACSLVGNDGFMYGKHTLREKLAMKELDFQEIRLEIQAQVDRFHDLFGEKPFHVDGHQHVHLLPGICEIFCDILRKNGIYATRLPLQDISKTVKNKEFLQSVLKNCYTAKPIFDQHHIRYTDNFVGLDFDGTSFKPILDKLSDVLKTNRHDYTFCEYMVHPGYRTGQDGGCGCGPDDYSQSINRENEMDFLCDKKWTDMLKNCDVRLTDFRTVFSVPNI